MNLSNVISREGKYIRELSEWLESLITGNKTLVEAKKDFRAQGLPLLIKIHQLGRIATSLNEFITYEDTANVTIASIIERDELTHPTIKDILTRYTGISDEEYESILDCVKYKSSNRKRYINSPLIDLYDLLYLLEKKHQHENNPGTSTATHLIAAKYRMDRAEASELYRSIKKLINNK